MSTVCEKHEAEHTPDPVRELLCKAHAIGFSEEELDELRKFYGRREGDTK